MEVAPFLVPMVTLVGPRGAMFTLALLVGCGPSLGTEPVGGESHGSTGHATDDGDDHDSGLDSGEDSGEDSSTGSEPVSTSSLPPDTDDVDECEPQPPAEGPMPTCTPTGQPYLYFTTWADQRVYAYDPEANTIDYDARIQCAPCAATTGIGASTVDSDGRLWLYYPGAGLYVVDPTTMLCSEPVLDAERGLPTLRSMGLVHHDEGGMVYATATEDELGAADHIVRIDPASFEIETLGPLEQELSFRSLAGHADGRVLGLLDFFEGNPQAPLNGQIIEVDPEDGQTLATLFELQPTPGQSIPSALAWWHDQLFAFGLYDGFGGAVMHIDVETEVQALVLEDIRVMADNAEISTFTGAGASACSARSALAGAAGPVGPSYSFRSTD